MLGRENSLTFKNISTVKTTVKMLLRMFSIFLSVDQGGMLGLSMASVMQLAAMKMRTMKSNQFLLVRSSHCIRNLHRTVGGASLRVKAKEEEEEVDVVVKRRVREREERKARERKSTGIVCKCTVRLKDIYVGGAARLHSYHTDSRGSKGG